MLVGERAAEWRSGRAEERKNSRAAEECGVRYDGIGRIADWKTGVKEATFLQSAQYRVLANEPRPLP